MLPPSGLNVYCKDDIKVMKFSEITSKGRCDGGGERLYKKFMRLNALHY